MARPLPPFEGSCLCGSVQVRLRASPLLTLACHCRDCQKLCASAYSLTTMFPRDGFSCTGPLIHGGLGASGRVHSFCEACLSFVYSQIGGADQRINLRTSVLDDAAFFPPYVELMTAEKLPWVTVPVVRSYVQYPETLAEVQSLMEDYAKAD